MRVFRFKSRRMGVALVAAWALMLQALMGAFTPGMAASAPLLDAFGNPLCITSPAGDDTGPRHHDTLTDCCALACGMLVLFIPDGGALSSLSNPMRPAAQPIGFARESSMPVFGPEGWSILPRSPPPTLA